ncbi:alpha/beta fold hydrolase [Acinetobacter larvae]|uniref:Alpha/beta hydrolase n=1 Tax=Acinetobacter larvae TaxID=1789224 RepID=A0A1B2M039_9GAMM|nr:alpha/beta fold hydrolase [Acinetobacter larvae]AOA58552.1 alpha/beta hydrolase [Acinetobacter larvae]
MKPLYQRFTASNRKAHNLAARLFNAHQLRLSQQQPFDVIYRLEHLQVRYYPAVQKRYLEPLVFVAPLAIDMSIYDLLPYRSLVQYFSQHGFEVYLLDWGVINKSHHQLNFLSFIEQYLPQCIEQICQHAHSAQITLHGWSMAGLFAALYTSAQSQQSVKNLVVLGSPIDSHASGYIGKICQTLDRIIRSQPTLHKICYQEKIPSYLLQTSGILNSLAFKLVDPKGWFNAQKNLLLKLADRQSVREHATMGSFLNHMFDYPGGIVKDMLFQIWLKNALLSGKITLQDRQFDLKNIDCPLLVGAGQNDQIVSREAVYPLTYLTSSQDLSFQLIPGGHLGLMSSQQSAQQFWPFLLAWLQQRCTVNDSTENINC